MIEHVYEILVFVNVICVLVCSLKIEQNRKENLARMKLLRKLQCARIELRRERVLTDAAVKRARAYKSD